MATRWNSKEEKTQRNMDGVRQSTSNRGLVKEDTRTMDKWWNSVVGEVKPLFCAQICLDPRKWWLISEFISRAEVCNSDNPRQSCDCQPLRAKILTAEQKNTIYYTDGNATSVRR